MFIPVKGMLETLMFVASAASMSLLVMWGNKVLHFHTFSTLCLTIYLPRPI